MTSVYRWTYNHREGGADVMRFASTDHGPSAQGEWVANCANGIVAQAMCSWLDVYTAGELPLDVNPPRLYAKN